MDFSVSGTPASISVTHDPNLASNNDQTVTTRDNSQNKPRSRPASNVSNSERPLEPSLEQVSTLISCFFRGRHPPDVTDALELLPR